MKFLDLDEILSKIDNIVDYLIWGIIYVVLGFLGGAVLAMFVVFILSFLIPIELWISVSIVLTLPFGIVCSAYLIKQFHEGKKYRKEMLERKIWEWQNWGKQRLERRFGDEWLAIRTQVLKRDNYRCVNCGQTGTELHVHHIIPKSEGGTDELDNLVTLCVKCHSVQDGKGHNLINLEESDL